MPTVAKETYSVGKLSPFIDPDDARTISVEFEATQTLAAGTVLGRVTATGRYKAYANGNADGSENAELILEWPIVVDASRNITIQGDYNAPTNKTAPAYWRGSFKISDLTGLDAPGVQDMNARVILGSITTGILVLH